MKMYFYHHYHSGRWWLLYPSRDAARLLTEGDNHLILSQAVLRPMVITSTEMSHTIRNEQYEMNHINRLEYCRNCSPDLLVLLLGDARK